MSRTSYYYDPPGSLNLVEKPGELCDGCCDLATISPAGSLVPMPCDEALTEYGHEEGNVHMHPKCAKAILAKYMSLTERAQVALAKWQP